METTWADRIRDLEERKWSLTAIAGAIGLSPQGVSDIKQGRTKAPTGMSAVRLYELHVSGALPGGSEKHGDDVAGPVLEAEGPQGQEVHGRPEDSHAADAATLGAVGA